MYQFTEKELIKMQKQYNEKHKVQSYNPQGMNKTDRES